MKRLIPLPLLLFLAPAAAAQARVADPYDAVDRLAAALKRSTAIAREAPPSAVPNGRAEGALHVVRMLIRAIDEELAWADTKHPYFQAQDERFAKLALGNPDNLYLVSRIDDDAVYRISGRRGTTADFSVQVYQGYPGVGRPFEAVGSLDVDELVVDADGNFEIFVGGTPRETNWIELRPHSRRILARYTYGDWMREHAGELRIERVGTRGTRSSAPDDREVTRRLDAAAGYLIDAMKGYLATVEQVFANVPVNALAPLRRTGAGGLVGQYSTTGRYDLQDDQAIVVSTLPAKSRYQGFQIGTEWFEAFDFANRVTSLNTVQARLSSDGRYYFVVATRDPGVANWLDTADYPQGQMLLRWQGAEGLGPEHQPRIELVPLDELRNHLPDDEPTFGADQRRAQIAARQDAIERRYGLLRR